MKKKIVIVMVLIAGLIGMFGGCGNQTMLDTKFTFNKAIIKMADGNVVYVEVDKWSDYDGEQIQIISKDGTIYLTSSIRCDLINDKAVNK